MFQNNCKTTKLIYPSLSYKIMKITFDIQNKLGNRLQEKYYQRAFEHELTKQGIGFRSQIFVPIQVSKGRLGSYFIDLIIENKIIIEIKVKSLIYNKDVHQVLAYLSLTNCRLGIVINFGSPRITFKRVINSSITSQ